MPHTVLTLCSLSTAGRGRCANAITLLARLLLVGTSGRALGLVLYSVACAKIKTLPNLVHNRREGGKSDSKSRPEFRKA